LNEQVQASKGHTYRAFELVAKILHGIVNVNSPTVNDEIHAPMGGVRDSGWGRTGPDSLAGFTDVIWINTTSSERQFPVLSLDDRAAGWGGPRPSRKEAAVTFTVDIHHHMLPDFFWRATNEGDHPVGATATTLIPRLATVRPQTQSHAS
jgi:hypothetical protein